MLEFYGKEIFVDYEGGYHTIECSYNSKVHVFYSNNEIGWNLHSQTHDYKSSLFLFLIDDDNIIGYERFDPC